MVCKYCGNTLVENAAICDRCGNTLGTPTIADTKVPQPLIPKGFNYDDASALYYRSELSQDESGTKVQLVTYYDADNQTYTQATYPLEDSAKDKEPAFDTNANMQTQNTSAIPEGFVYDEASGWYYRAEIAQDASGTKVQLITYYDAENQTYTQATYPLETLSDAPESTQTAAGDALKEQAQSKPVIPEGFTYDEASGWYCRYEITVGKDGLQEQVVTYYDPQNQTYAQAAYPLVQKTPVQPTFVDNTKGGQGTKKNTAVPPAGTGKPKKKTILALSAVVVLICLCGVGYMMGWHEKLPFLSAAGEAKAPVENTQRPDVSASPDETDAPLPAVAQAQGLTDFTHSSYLYMRAHEDETYVYFMRKIDYGATDAQLYRLRKKDEQIESIITTTIGSITPVSSFTVMGDYIYYSSKINETTHAYFKIAKAGGAAQFLFLAERSGIAASEGKLYFLFHEQNALGIYDPEQDAEPHLVALNNGLAPDQYAFHGGFSVVDGYLYYGELTKDGDLFYRFDLNSAQKEILLSSKALSEPNICNPFYVDGDSYYITLDKNTGLATWRVLRKGESASTQLSAAQYAAGSGELICGAYLGNQVLYQSDDEFRLAKLDSIDQFTVAYAHGKRPMAVSENYLFLPEGIFSLRNKTLLEYDNAHYALLGDLNAAYNEALEKMKESNPNGDTPQQSETPSESQPQQSNAPETQAPETQAPEASSGKWTDNTGYKPKYFKWKISSSDGGDYDDPDFRVGQWVSEDGQTVAYLYFGDGPDAMDYEVCHNGKVYIGYANMADLENGRYGYDPERPLELYPRNRKEILFIIDGEKIPLRLLRAKIN